MQIRIAVPYRSDGGGKAHNNDLSLLERGQLCTSAEMDAFRHGVRAGLALRVGSQDCTIKAVTLISQDLYNSCQASDHYFPADWQGIQASDKYVTIAELGSCDALFVPGGPASNPANLEGTPKASGRSVARAAKKFETDRHAQEIAAIAFCHTRNIPIFAVCGGSWRLAAELGAKIVSLQGGTRKKHNKSFDAKTLMTVAHDVKIETNSHLRQLFETNYRGYASAKQGEPYSELTIDVNSAHWDASDFGEGAAINVTARDGGVVEGYEDPKVHFCVGVQWHPEYAQVRLMKGDNDKSAHHKALMQNFMKAATAGQAARHIQALARGFLARQRVKKMRAGAAETVK